MSLHDRTRPYPARLIDRYALSSEQSARKTLHIALSIAGAGFSPEPGDVVGVYAENEPALVDRILERLGLSGDERVTLSASWAQPGEPIVPPASIEIAIRHALQVRLSLGTPPLKLLRAAVERLEDEDEAVALEDLCEDGAALDAYLIERDLLDFLDEHPTLSFSAEELARLLPALQPRTYSVASSLRRHPDEIHLTVGIIRWERAGRSRIGVASAHFERMRLGDTIPMYWQASKHFRMPAPEVPLILIGPGTGVAPFRGFLQEREVAGGAESWLFFGAQTRAHDFYYREELERWQTSGLRLDLAFSRDQPDRIYVQQRMREASDELFAWLQRGAHVYLCGDASKMAPDVERALVEIVSTHGEDGAAYVKKMRDEKRLRRDVY